MIKLRNIYKEAAYVQRPPIEKPEKGPEGYVITKQETDPETGTSHTYLESEPELLKIAKEVGRFIKTMKHYQALPNTPDYADIKAQAISVISSLRNAESKARDLYEKILSLRTLGK